MFPMWTPGQAFPFDYIPFHASGGDELGEEPAPCDSAMCYVYLLVLSVFLLCDALAGGLLNCRGAFLLMCLDI